MSTVTVYYFRRYEISKDENVRSQRPGTIKAIQQLNCEPIMESSQEVDASLIDADGLVAKMNMKHVKP